MVSRLLRQGIQPRTVIDVGANIGQFSVTVAKLFSNVSIHCFEPLPVCLPVLKRNTQELPNVRIYPIALGESEGTGVFHVNSHSHSSSLLRLAEGHREAFPLAREVDAIRVSLSTLDKVFADLELTPPVMLKLDVQGYEATTIRGGFSTLRRVDYIVCETSLKPMYDGEMLFPDLARMIEMRGFRFMRPVGWLTNPSNGEILQIDALFERKDLAVA
jgi:FkbM family methyltransferase